MAKGDDSRARNQMDYSGAKGEALGGNLRTGVLEPQFNEFRDRYRDAANQQAGDYSNLMSGYNEFAKTGGFSPSDISAIRARSVSPTRAVYANANREVDRSRALQGGYSPGFGVLKARMARDMSTGLSDAATGAEAAIAQMKQQGRLAGMTGATSLYGTTPGLTNMFGNQVLESSGQLSRGVENEMNFGNEVARLKLGLTQAPGKWESTVGRVKDIFDIGSNIATAAGGIGSSNSTGWNFPGQKAPL